MHSFSKWSHGTLSLSLSVSLNDPSFCCQIWALLNLSETQTTPLLIRKCGGVEMGKIVSVFVVLGFLVLNCFANFGSHAQRLPDDEGKFTICQQHIKVLIFLKKKIFSSCLNSQVWFSRIWRKREQNFSGSRNNWMLLSGFASFRCLCSVCQEFIVRVSSVWMLRMWRKMLKDPRFEFSVCSL